MIEPLKENRSFIIIGIAVLIGFFLPVENFFQMNKYESLKVPEFTLPTDLKTVSAGKPGHYKNINTRVLLGHTPQVELVDVPGRVVTPVNSEKLVKSNTRPRKKARKKHPKLRLKAIMIDGDSRTANINGAMMKVGGRIYKHRVLKIDDEGVLLDGPQGKYFLKMIN